MRERTNTAAREIVAAGERNIARWQRMEEEVAEVLSRLLAQGKITGYVRYERLPASAREPADFSVMCVYRGKAASRRFGMSTSVGARRVRESLFPRTKVLCFPPGTKPETIEKRVRELFKR